MRVDQHAVSQIKDNQCSNRILHLLNLTYSHNFSLRGCESIRLQSAKNSLNIMYAMLKQISQKYAVSDVGYLIHLPSGNIRRGSVINNHGQRVVTWFDDYNKQHTSLIYRLVAQTFIPNPDNLEQVNHKDHDPGNNRVDNLEWVSRSQNLRKRRPWKGKGNRFCDAETQTI